MNRSVLLVTTTIDSIVVDGQGLPHENRVNRRLDRRSPLAAEVIALPHMFAAHMVAGHRLDSLSCWLILILILPLLRFGMVWFALWDWLIECGSPRFYSCVVYLVD